METRPDPQQITEYEFKAAMLLVRSRMVHEFPNAVAVLELAERQLRSRVKIAESRVEELQAAWHKATIDAFMAEEREQRAFYAGKGESFKDYETYRESRLANHS